MTALGAIVIANLIVNAHALMTPDSTRMAEIQNQINEGSRAGQEMGEQGKLREEVKTPGNKKYISDPIARQKVIDETWRETSRQREIREQSFSKAIWLTIQAYRILPPGTELQGTVVMPGFERKDPVSWIPIYDEHTPKHFIDKHGHRGRDSDSTGASGLTATEGVSYIFPEAFESPSHLASVLVHEKVHFEQITSWGRGNVKTHAEMEVEAFKEEVNLLNSGVLGFPTDEFDVQKGRLEQQLSLWEPKATKERADRDRGLDTPFEDVKSHTTADLKKIKEGAMTLRTQVERENAVATFHQIAKKVCSVDPGIVAWTLRTQSSLYNEACGAFPDGDASHSFPDPQRGFPETCEDDATLVISMCRNIGDILGDIMTAVQRHQAPSGPPKGDVDRANRDAKQIEARERAKDAKSLGSLNIDMVNTLDKMCDHPENSWELYDVLCSDRRQVRDIVAKYTRRGQQSPEPSWDGFQSHQCAWDLWHDVENNRGICFSDGATEGQWARWLGGRAEELNRQYYPAPPPPPPPKRDRIDPGGGRGGGGGSNPCGARCTFTGGGCSCPPDL